MASKVYTYKGYSFRLGNRIARTYKNYRMTPKACYDIYVGGRWRSTIAVTIKEVQWIINKGLVNDHRYVD